MPNKATQDSSGAIMGSIAGLFHDESRAEDALDELRKAGFSGTEIGVATAAQSTPAAKQLDTGDFWSKVANVFGKQEHTESASDLEDSLAASGVPQQQAQYLNRSLSKGDILVTVRATGDRAVTARTILEQEGADMGAGEASLATGTASGTIQDERKIELVGEILRVHKERVQRGEVRLRKEVVTENQSVEVPVTREELVIERVSAEGRESAGEVGSGEKEIRVPLSEERVRVEKKPVVNEEIKVGKRQVQETKRVSDTLRREELRTEHEGDMKDEEISGIKDKKRRSA
jgi:uncharacterized protein (TIGR02271 family)